VDNCSEFVEFQREHTGAGELKIVNEGAESAVAALNDGGGTTATQRHIRGSTLLLAGRMLSLLINFAVQVLTVRYLSKSDFGAFAYALAIVSTGSSMTLLGLNKAINRFVPIYHEARDYRSMFGTIVLAFGATLGLGLALIALVFGLQGVLTRSVVSDPLSVGLLLILIALSPLQALDSLFQAMLAVFAHPRSIFFRRHVLGPGLKLAAVVLVISSQGSVYLLATCYLFAGVLGVGIYVLLLQRVLKEQKLLHWLDLRKISVPAREIFGFSLPLITTDVFFNFKMTMAVVLLEYFRGTTDVAEFRAVVPVAGLSLVVMQSLRLLFTPMASRLFARNDVAGINNLYWQSAAWIAVVTFPFFAVCFFLAEPVIVLLFGTRYAGAGLILAVLAVGNYFNAALGLNTYTLQVYAKVRFITFINGLSVIIALGLNLWLIPHHGALGAAIATSGAIVTYNLLNHFGLASRTEIDLLQWRYLKVYLRILGVTLGLLLLHTTLNISTPMMVILVALVSFLLLRLNRATLDIERTFPELLQIPLLRRLLAVERDS
jgi:O-antigen/teichoic acid export membrane protein